MLTATGEFPNGKFSQWSSMSAKKASKSSEEGKSVNSVQPSLIGVWDNRYTTSSNVAMFDVIKSDVISPEVFTRDVTMFDVMICDVILSDDTDVRRLLLGFECWVDRHCPASLLIPSFSKSARNALRSSEEGKSSNSGHSYEV